MRFQETQKAGELGFLGLHVEVKRLKGSEGLVE